jgi:hypothetical protein
MERARRGVRYEALDLRLKHCWREWFADERRGPEDVGQLRARVTRNDNEGFAVAHQPARDRL